MRGWSDMTVERGTETIRHLGIAPEVRTLRAVCTECGAHAAVVTAGTSRTGACSVCGSESLRVLEKHEPPPRRWAV